MSSSIIWIGILKQQIAIIEDRICNLLAWKPRRQLIDAVPFVLGLSASYALISLAAWACTFQSVYFLQMWSYFPILKIQIAVCSGLLSSCIIYFGPRKKMLALVLLAILAPPLLITILKIAFVRGSGFDYFVWALPHRFPGLMISLRVVVGWIWIWTDPALIGSLSTLITASVIHNSEWYQRLCSSRSAGVSLPVSNDIHAMEDSIDSESFEWP